MFTCTMLRILLVVSIKDIRVETSYFFVCAHQLDSQNGILWFHVFPTIDYQCSNRCTRLTGWWLGHPSEKILVNWDD